MKMVSVLIPPVLRPFTGGVATLSTPPGTFADVIRAIQSQQPALVERITDENGTIRRFVNAYVDGTDVRALGGAQADIPDGSVITVISAVAGG